MKTLISEETGQGLTEYGLVMGVISLAVILAIGTLREEIIFMFTKAAGVLTKNNELTSP